MVHESGTDRLGRPASDLLPTARQGAVRQCQAVSGSVSRPALLALSVLQSCSHPQHPALILTREGGTSRAGCGTQHPRGDRGRERCARAPCGVASGAGQQPDSIPATRFRLQGHRTCAGSGTEFSAQSRTFTINSDFGILLHGLHPLSSFSVLRRALVCVHPDVARRELRLSHGHTKRRGQCPRQQRLAQGVVKLLSQMQS